MNLPTPNEAAIMKTFGDRLGHMWPQFEVQPLNVFMVEDSRWVITYRLAPRTPYVGLYVEQMRIAVFAFDRAAPHAFNLKLDVVI